MRVSTVVGLAFSAFGFLLGAQVIVERIVRPDVPLGWSSVLVAISFFAGVQLVMLGLVGEYLGRLFLASNQTPQFVVREVFEGAPKPRLHSPHATAAAFNSRPVERERPTPSEPVTIKS
jgi:undecaprenyl-phosphate 4-deoxy-4-formamido-L-arabinose transferase